MEDERIPGVSRQQLKQLKAMPLPNFRRWLLEYTDIDTEVPERERFTDKEEKL